MEFPKENIIDKWLEENSNPKIDNQVKFEAFTYNIAYKTISKFYGDKKTERTGVPLMDHIDEGLRVLISLDAPHDALCAYCLHPIYQNNSDLFQAYNDTKPNSLISLKIMILTMEYRNIANAYLSTRHIDSIEDIQLSPLPEVNIMLLADKIQNHKDFKLYHSDTHPRAKELEEYFQNWFKRLCVSDEEYVKLVKCCEAFDFNK